VDQVQLNMKASSDDMSAGGGHADFVLMGKSHSPPKPLPAVSQITSVADFPDTNRKSFTIGSKDTILGGQGPAEIASRPRVQLGPSPLKLGTEVI